MVRSEADEVAQGESMKAGNKGMPGTPRDGAPVEITGLLKSALRWVDELAAKGSFPADGVTNKDGKKVTYKTWADLIQKSFEEYYFIPEGAWPSWTESSPCLTRSCRPLTRRRAPRRQHLCPAPRDLQGRVWHAGRKAKGGLPAPCQLPMRDDCGAGTLHA